MADTDIRPVQPDERRAALNTIAAALLGGPPDDALFESTLPSWEASDSLAAWDGERCVGVAAAFRFDSTVPGGGRLDTAGVTRVGVQPTHTRRGTLTRLLDRLLREAPERGQPLASLHASEATIYGRFGFGVASESVAATITTRKTAPWRAPSAGGSLRILRHDEVLDVVPALYDRVARLRTGSVSRPEWWWHRFYADAIRLSSARGDKGHFVVVHTSTDGHDDGFASYELGWSDGFGEPPAGAGSVHDLWAASPAVEIELWRFLAGIDLIESWRAERPVDEAARWAMNDPRAYEVRARFDDQWIRLLDVDTCLAARRYGDASESVTLAVTDPMFASNNDRWTISADGAWRSDATPDLTVDVGVLSAAYLGGRSWHLLTAGSGAPLDPDRCDRLDALFRIGPPPFCGTGY